VLDELEVLEVLEVLDELLEVLDDSGVLDVEDAEEDEELDSCGVLPEDSTGSGRVSVLIGVLCGDDELCDDELSSGSSTYPGRSDHGIVETGTGLSPPKTSSSEEEAELLTTSGSGRFSVRLPGVNVELTGL